MYDEDRSGAIGMDEMIEILATLHDMEGANKDNVENIAKSMFLKMEIDENDELTLEQFTGACLMQEEMVQLLTGSDNKNEFSNL